MSTEPAAPLNIYRFTDVVKLMKAVFAAQASGSPTDLAKWLSDALGCTPEQVFNMLAGDRFVQPEQVPILARAMRLNARGQEYLRRLVVLQNATTENRKEARLSVWELHAAHCGIPAEAIVEILSREHVHGATEGALLPILAALHRFGAPLKARDLAPLLTAPPEPKRLRAACKLASEGVTLGTWESLRMLAVDGPGSPTALSTAAWHGLLDLTRECIQRVPMAERDHGTVTWTADKVAARAAERALARCERDLRQIVEKSADQPVTRLYLVSLTHLTLTDVLDRRRPAVEIDSSILPAHQEWSRAPLERPKITTSADGRPCIYDSLRFRDFAQRWIQWRKRTGEPCSAEHLAGAMGVSKTVANDLSRGAQPLLPQHVKGVITAYALTEEEAPFVEGMARYEQATDPADKAREHNALLDYAAARRTCPPETHTWRIQSYWGSRAIWALGFLPFFRSNGAWVYLALKGRVPLNTAVEIVEAFDALGMFAPPGVDAGRPTRQVVRLDQPNASVAILAETSFHDSLLRMLQHELLFPERDQHLKSWILALSDGAFVQVRERLERLRKEIAELGVDAQRRSDRGETVLDRVLLTNFAFVPVSARLVTSLTPEGRRR